MSRIVIRRGEPIKLSQRVAPKARVHDLLVLKAVERRLAVTRQVRSLSDPIGRDVVTGYTTFMDIDVRCTKCGMGHLLRDIEVTPAIVEQDHRAALYGLLIDYGMEPVCYGT